MQFVLFFLVATFSAILGYTDQDAFSLSRQNSYSLTGYYSSPENIDVHPLVILIQGSEKQTVKIHHNKIKPLVTSLKLGLITLECPGVGTKKVDDNLFNTCDSIDERLSSYHFLIEQLRNNFLPAWNRELILIGISDGGIVAGKLAKEIPEIKALVLIETGGGMKVKDELLISLLRKKRITNAQELEKETHLLKDHFQQIEKNPANELFWNGHTYRFWASIMNQQLFFDIKDLRIPIFLVGNAKSDRVPIESIDRFASCFGNNLVYKQYENTGDAPFKDFAKWMSSISMELKVFKSKKTLEVHKFGRCVKAYPIAVGKSEKGHKMREGDMKTPEGEYTICVKNPKSKYYLSVGLNYPNNKDAENALHEKVISQKEYKDIISCNLQGKIPLWKTPLGGEIFIHGYLEEQDWTHGCIRMYNKDIKELYPQIALGTKVTIFP